MNQVTKRCTDGCQRKLKLGRNAIIEAHKDGNLSFTDLPAELKGDPDFWLDVIKRDSSIWPALPKDYENDPTFAHVIDCFCRNELVAEVFARFPFLADERDMWLAIYFHLPSTSEASLETTRQNRFVATKK